MIGANAFPQFAVAASSAAPIGAYLALDATLTNGGKDWLLYSTNGTATEGQGKFCIKNQTGAVTPISILPTGTVGIMTTSPNSAYALDVNGIVNASSYASASDARYKMNIHTLDHSLDDLLNLRGVSYDLDRAKWPAKHFPEGRQIGFIAQELEKVFPELVQTDANGYKSVMYQNVTPILVEAVKTLNAKVDAQQKQIDELKAQAKENAEIKKQIAELVRAMKRMQDERSPEK